MHQLDVHLPVVVNAVGLSLEDAETKPHVPVVPVQFGENALYVLTHDG